MNKKHPRQVGRVRSPKGTALHGSRLQLNRLNCPGLQVMPAALKTSFLVLDIEGTTSPISFVATVMFPYARKALRQHLRLSWGSQETQEDVEELRKQVGVGAIPLPHRPVLFFARQRLCGLSGKAAHP